MVKEANTHPLINGKEANLVFDQVRYWHPYVSPFDPCPPMLVKSFVVPPNLFISFQPPGLPQHSPAAALASGTLWPAFYSPYPIPGPKKREGE